MQEEARDAVGSLSVPRPDQDLTLSTELAVKIGKVCPFWATLLKKQTINDMKDGDAYISGFAEMFSRIFKALPDPEVLGRLTIEDVYVVDEEIQGGGAEELIAAYPNLAPVTELGPYGGGIMLAYGMFERSIAGGLPKAPKPKVEVQPPADPKDVVSDLEQGLDESLAPEAAVIGPGPITSPQVNAPISLIVVYTKDAWCVSGELMFLSQAAQLHDFCMQAFNCDPVIKGTPSGQVHFEFNIPKRS